MDLCNPRFIGSVKQEIRGKMKSKTTEILKIDSKVTEIGMTNSSVATNAALEVPSETTMKRFTKMSVVSKAESIMTRAAIEANRRIQRNRIVQKLSEERGDVPGWVLVVLMTTGLVTAIWTIAAPRLSTILKNSLDAMNGIR